MHLLAFLEKTRQYSEENLEAILEANPDLGEEIGMDAGGGLETFRFRLGGSGLSPQVWSPDREDRSLRGWLYRPDTQALRTDKLGVIVGSISPERAEALGLEAGTGLLVESTYPGTLAEILGVGAGDVLVELNGKVLVRADDISAVLQARPLGLRGRMGPLRTTGLRTAERAEGVIDANRCLWYIPTKIFRQSHDGSPLDDRPPEDTIRP